MGAFEDYRKSVDDSRAWFAESHAPVVTATNVLTDGFTSLTEAVREGRDGNGKTHVSLAPFLWILHRQAFVALDLLASRQAYQAWLIVRPGIESALIVGKWLDDPKNAEIWQNRLDDPQMYSRTYSGSALQSKSLVHSKDIQTALKRINDLFAHPNPSYYTRHTTITPQSDGLIHVGLSFFDTGDFHWANVLGMLHLLIVVQDALARAFASIFVNLEHEPNRYGLRQFEKLHQVQAEDAPRSGPAEQQVINEIGLWYLAPAS